VTRFGGSDRYQDVTLIQSTYGNPGNLEIIARRGDRLAFFWRDSGPAFQWSGPYDIASGASGSPSLIQGRFGTPGNFELVAPLVGGGLGHWWRNNDDSRRPWSTVTRFGGTFIYRAAALIQSKYGNPGNLEVIAQRDPPRTTSNQLTFFWRDSGPAFRWTGPFVVASGVFGGECIRVHYKILTDPDVAIDTMTTSMEEVYTSVGIRVVVASRENLNLPLLNDLEIERCVRGVVTAEQTELFQNRNNVGVNDIVVYFVRTTVPPSNGCAAHPAGRPGAVVTQGATRWTLGHEIGHVLNLDHVDNNDQLMTGNGTANITNPPPDLIRSEQDRMFASALTRQC
jgi:hypothetical protein